jgi:sulfite reductase beta subunit-like hemoprotein
LIGGFNGDNFQLIRFHGMYQQDDRDIRPERISMFTKSLVLPKPNFK